VIRSGPPSIECPLVGDERDDPATGDQLVSGLLTFGELTPKVSAIQGLDRPRAQHFPRIQVKSAEEMSEKGGNQSGPRASGNESESPAGTGTLRLALRMPVENARKPGVSPRQIVRELGSSSALGPFEEACVPEPPE